MTTTAKTSSTNALQAVVAFFEGRMSAQDFESALYGDPGFEELLTDDPTLPRDTYIGASTYQFVLEQDYQDPGGVLNVQGALSEFLTRRGVDHATSKDAADAYDAILEAQPEWLDLDTKYVKEHYLDRAGGRTGNKLSTWLRKKLSAVFRCAAKPPKWLQSPAWPIGDKGPMVFLGQLSIPDYFHDSGYGELSIRGTTACSQTGPDIVPCSLCRHRPATRCQRQRSTRRLTSVSPEQRLTTRSQDSKPPCL